MFYDIKMVLFSILITLLCAFLGAMLGISLRSGYESYKKEQYIMKCVENHIPEECVQKYKNLQEVLKRSGEK